MPTIPIRSTTQNHLDIADINHNLVLLKDGSVAMVLRLNAVNFDLLSEQEQEATIYAYAALLNSLTFSVQILIRSQRKDVSNYVKLLENQEKKTYQEKRRLQINRYRQFIAKIVKEGNVLDKKFYVVIPYSRLELGLSAASPLTFKAPTTLPYDKDYIFQKAATALEPKRDHLIRQFNRIGLPARQLTDAELTQLLYSVSNPYTVGNVKLMAAEDYHTPLVGSHLKSPTPNQNPPLADKTSSPPAVPNKPQSTPSPAPPTKSL